MCATPLRGGNDKFYRVTEFEKSFITSFSLENLSLNAQNLGILFIVVTAAQHFLLFHSSTRVLMALFYYFKEHCRINFIFIS